MPKIMRTSHLILYPMISEGSSNTSESILAVTTRGCCRRDFHVLAENGLKGFVSVHHGTKHQGLGGRNGEGVGEHFTARLGLEWPLSDQDSSLAGTNDQILLSPRRLQPIRGPSLSSLEGCRIHSLWDPPTCLSYNYGAYPSRPSWTLTPCSRFLR